MYRFIVVDDEDAIVNNFDCYMDWSEISYEFASGFTKVSQALEFLHSDSSIRLIITDIKMSEMSGLDFCKTLIEEFPYIHIIVMSGYKEFEWACQACSLGCIAYLTKPISCDDLRKTLIKASEIMQKDTVVSDPDFKSSMDLIDDYVECHISESISIENVARHINVSPTYFSKYFKTLYGKNFSEYLSEKKIEKAVLLLTDPKIRINEICDMLGYRSMQHFLKLFKKHTGKTPTQLRKESRS